MAMIWGWCWFFFFQAEDGIRDIGVTGVQTCALPIYEGVELLLRDRLAEGRGHDVLRVAGRDVCVRVGDRRPDERRERLLRALRLGRQLVEVRADLAGRARRAERVAGRPPVVLEDRGSERKS